MNDQLIQAARKRITIADELIKATRIILKGFDEGMFVRNIDNDHDTAWAIKLLPYIKALAVAQACVEELDAKG